MNYDDYVSDRIRNPNPFRNNRFGDHDIELFENSEGYVDVRVTDFRTGEKVQKTFILQYKHNKGHRSFGGGILDSAKDTSTSKSVINPLLMLFL